MKSIIVSNLALIFTVTIGVLAPSAMAQNPEVDIFTAANATGQFTQLLGLIEGSGVGSLDFEGTLTVFAPIDGALEGNPMVMDLAANPTSALPVVAYHVVQGTFLSSDLSTGTLTSIFGSPIDVVVEDDGTVVLNGGQARVVLADIVGNNGVVHGIDGLLTNLAAAGDTPATMVPGEEASTTTTDAPSAAPEDGSDMPSGGSGEDSSSPSMKMALTGIVSMAVAALAFC